MYQCKHVYVLTITGVTMCKDSQGGKVITNISGIRNSINLFLEIMWKILRYNFVFKFNVRLVSNADTNIV